MNVLIVARTRMFGNARCIGGLARDGRSVRLLTTTGRNHNTNSPLQVGQTWDLTYVPRPNVTAPHVEDVLVSAQRLVGTQADLRGHLLSRLTPSTGDISRLFGGSLGFTASGNGFVCERLGVPNASTGFWIPARDLTLRDDGRHYDYDTGRGLSYVGELPALDVLPAGTLVRVSLARWWKPDDADADFEERCYLQLSGWY